MRENPRDAEQEEPAREIVKSRLRVSVRKRGCSEDHTQNESNESQFNLIRAANYEVRNTQYVARTTYCALRKNPGGRDNFRFTT